MSKYAHVEIKLFKRLRFLAANKSSLSLQWLNTERKLLNDFDK